MKYAIECKIMLDQTEDYPSKIDRLKLSIRGEKEKRIRK